LSTFSRRGPSLTYVGQDAATLVHVLEHDIGDVRREQEFQRIIGQHHPRHAGWNAFVHEIVGCTLDESYVFRLFGKLKLTICAPISGLPEVGFILCASRQVLLAAGTSRRVFVLLL
jgi:hypothetical protein